MIRGPQGKEAESRLPCMVPHHGFPLPLVMLLALPEHAAVELSTGRRLLLWLCSILRLMIFSMKINR